MSTKVLHIDSSIFPANSVSHQLGQNLMTQLGEQLGGLEVVHHELGETPIPHLDAVTLTSIGEGKAELADALIAEYLAADILVLGIPMYNFGVPSTLKAWFDHIARAGATFKYTDNGPVGLGGEKKVFVLLTRGGNYQGTPADSQTAFLETFLGFIGLKNIAFIYAEGLNKSGDSREQAIADAQLQIAKQVKLITEHEVA